jgi:hypothetical protein
MYTVAAIVITTTITAKGLGSGSRAAGGDGLCSPALSSPLAQTSSSNVRNLMTYRALQPQSRRSATDENRIIGSAKEIKRAAKEEIGGVLCVMR